VRRIDLTRSMTLAGPSSCHEILESRRISSRLPLELSGSCPKFFQASDALLKDNRAMARVRTFHVNASETGSVFQRVLPKPANLLA
jgi:hypothetical protein